jgi:proline dehydrogenase
MLLRSAILFASENRMLRGWMEHSSRARPLTRRFVAGNTLDDAVQAVRELASAGLKASLDSLGESVTNEGEAKRATAQYLESVHRISLLCLPASVSLKLTQLGLDISQALAKQNLEQIVEAGHAAGVRVEVDMEASPYVDRTLELVRECHTRWGNVRAVVQAYLYRTEEDIRSLNAAGVPVRLCKGAYQEHHDIAWPRKSDVDANYRKLTTLLLEEGTFPAIASHDEAMIAHARREIARIGLSADRYEFQMLFGIRRDLQQQLVAEGHPVRIYVPYGEAWYPYLMRRMAERPANLLFVMRNWLR